MKYRNYFFILALASMVLFSSCAPKQKVNTNVSDVPKDVEQENSNTKPECIVSGCNNEICAEEEMASACIYKEEFACYKTTRCERQKDGTCGWTQTPELVSCLEDN